jgi:hypothetical protein
LFSYYIKLDFIKNFKKTLNWLFIFWDNHNVDVTNAFHEIVTWAVWQVPLVSLLKKRLLRTTTNYDGWESWDNVSQNGKVFGVCWHLYKRNDCCTTISLCIIFFFFFFFPMGIDYLASFLLYLLFINRKDILGHKGQ